MAYSVLQKKDNAHADAIWACTWVKSEKTNENLIITGSLDDMVKVWTWDEDKQIQLKHTLEGHCLGVISLAANKEGTLLATNALDATVKFWDLETGEETNVMESHDQHAWKVAFSPDSRLVAIGTQNSTVSLFEVETRKMVGELDNPGKYIMALAFSPDGKFLAIASIDGPINIFDLQTSTLFSTLDGHAMPVRGLAFSPDSSILVTASDDKHVKMYEIGKSRSGGDAVDQRSNQNTASKDVHHAATLYGHGSWVVDVAFAPDGKRFATSSADNTVKIWDLAARECVHTFSAHSQQVSAASYSPNGSRLVSVSDDRSMVVYNTPV